MANKLTQSQLKTRTFILKIYRKAITPTLSNFKKFLKVFSDPANEVVTSKYDYQLISSFLSIYKFKSKDELAEIINLLHTTQLYNQNDCFKHWSDIIIKKLMENKSVNKIDLVEIILTDDTLYYSMFLFFYYIFTKSQNPIEIVKFICENIDKFNKLTINGLIGTIAKQDKKLLIPSLKYIIDNLKNLKSYEIDITSLEYEYKEIKNKQLKHLIRIVLFEVTNSTEYFDEELKNIFLI